MGPSKTCVVKYIRKGDAAINIVVSPETVVCEPPASGITSKKVYVDLFVGPDRIDYNSTANPDGFLCGVLGATSAEIAPGVGWTFGTDNGRFYYYIRFKPTANADHEIPFTVNYKGVTYNRSLRVVTINKGEKGEQGAVLRGPQAWSDCATGYAFKAGGSGEAWKDVVMYGSNYYSCVKSHTKTASNYPGSTEDTNNHYWQLGDKVELIATKILLSTYALVKNLGVECIDMKDSAGNIIFQAKDGNVTCKSGSFQNINVSGNITADTLNLKMSTVEDGDIPNGSLCHNASQIKLPELPNGVVRTIRVLNPLYSRTAPNDLDLIPATSKVYISTSISKLHAKQQTMTIQGGGYNAQEYWELMGIGESSRTTWITARLTDDQV